MQASVNNPPFQKMQQLGVGNILFRFFKIIFTLNLSLTNLFCKPQEGKKALLRSL